MRSAINQRFGTRLYAASPPLCRSGQKRSLQIDALDRDHPPAARPRGITDRS